MSIEWKDEYSVGITLIDQQHKQLVRLLDQLGESLTKQNQKEVTTHVALSLLRYTQAHFLTEERLMIKHSYPGYEAHRKEHESLAVRVANFQQSAERGSTTISEELYKFLSDWLVHHILETDKAYSPFFRSRDVH
jgi:hemerythrin